MIWFLINIALPFAPFLIKILLTVAGKQGNIHFELWDINEMLYLSIYYCIITLDVGIVQRTKKKNDVVNWSLDVYTFTEWPVIFKIIIVIIIIANCILLSQSYTNGLNDSFGWTYLRIIIPFNILLLLWNRFKHSRRNME